MTFRRRRRDLVRPRRPDPRPSGRRGRRRRRQRHRARPPQHDQAARGADEAEEVRRPRRLLHRVVPGLSATSPITRSRTSSYITRWRLEKKDPSAEISEPKKPIVFYIGREVPEKFKDAIKKGVELWQPAFEKAGFKNAIIGKDAPTVRENPDWDAEDARYSTIRWLPSTIENAMGPHVHDPRTGEILEADILMYHNILKLTRDWYFIQASPNDPKAQQLPLPDDLMNELITYVSPTRSATPWASSTT